MDFETETFVCHNPDEEWAFKEARENDATTVSAFNPQAGGNQTTIGLSTQSTGTLNRRQNPGIIGQGVRRLMPIETLRLQGFPDDWLDGFGFADGPKYAMTGNAVAVPCARWIGNQIVKAIRR